MRKLAFISIVVATGTGFSFNTDAAILVNSVSLQYTTSSFSDLSGYAADHSNQATVPVDSLMTASEPTFHYNYSDVGSGANDSGSLVSAVSFQELGNNTERVVINQNSEISGLGYQRGANLSNETAAIINFTADVPFTFSFAADNSSYGSSSGSGNTAPYYTPLSETVSFLQAKYQNIFVVADNSGLLKFKYLSAGDYSLYLSTFSNVNLGAGAGAAIQSTNGTFDFSFGAPALPEPSTWVEIMIGIGLAGTVLRSARCRSVNPTNTLLKTGY